MEISRFFTRKTENIVYHTNNWLSISCTKLCVTTIFYLILNLHVVVLARDLVYVFEMALQCYTLFILALSVRGYEIMKFNENADRWIEKEHNPYWLNIPWMLNGTQFMWNVNGTENKLAEKHTPNWMMQEPPFRPWFYQFDRKYPYMEVNRPYRIYPTAFILKRWNKLNVYDTVTKSVGCYCTTAWKIYTPLAGCAVLTNRHILTTATSTELVLKKYLRPEKVNMSHPFPFVSDLAIWATPKNLAWDAIFCTRAAPSWYWYEHTRPYNPQKVLVVGYQYIKAHGKVPNVFFKYATRSPNFLDKCPKVEWGEYFCLGGQTETYAKYGIESGAAYHRLLAEYRPSWWQGYDGLAAMCAFSMNLRSEGLVHYFTVLNVHHVLDWLYDAYTGQQQYVWLDYRYQDTKGKAPVPKSWHLVSYYDWPYRMENYLLPIPFY